MSIFLFAIFGSQNFLAQLCVLFVVVVIVMLSLRFNLHVPPSVADKCHSISLSFCCYICCCCSWSDKGQQLKEQLPKAHRPLAAVKLTWAPVPDAPLFLVVVLANSLTNWARATSCQMFAKGQPRKENKSLDLKLVGMSLWPKFMQIS